MLFTIDFTARINGQIRKAASEIAPSAASVRFWKDLKAALCVLADRASEIGEVSYVFKHSNFESRLTVRGFLAIQFAIHEEHRLVFVQNVSFSGPHPYPVEIEQILK
jgi:hypothetical protein